MPGIPGFDGYTAAASFQQNRRANNQAMEIQAQQAQWEAEDRPLKRQAAEMAIEEGRGQAADAKISREQTRLLNSLSRTYASQDPTALDKFYAELPDGIDLAGPTEAKPDGRFVVKHPRGDIVGTWDELFFGKPTEQGGAGIGLYQMVNPDAFLSIPGQRAAAASAGVEQANKLEIEGVKSQGRLSAAQLAARTRLEVADIGAASRVQAAGINRNAGLAPQVVQSDQGFELVDRNTAVARPITSQVPGDGMGPPAQVRPAPPRAGIDTANRLVNADVSEINRALLPGQTLTPQQVADQAHERQSSRDLIARDRGIQGGAPRTQPSTPKAVNPSDAGSSDFVVGTTYEDDQGNRAVYQADGSWKEL